jgi:hypothetical protein
MLAAAQVAWIKWLAVECPRKFFRVAVLLEAKDNITLALEDDVVIKLRQRTTEEAIHLLLSTLIEVRPHRYLMWSSFWSRPMV